MSKGKKIALWSLGVSVFILAVVGGWAYRTVSTALGSQGHRATFMGTVQGMQEVIGDPRQGFVGPDGQEADKINILCMGIDDNWTDSDVVYTHNARTDTLFLLTLDLKNQKASMLSIPRDTYTHIAGTNYSDKINSAYATGGPLRSVQTVAELLGVHADHYLVLNIDATKKMVAALGGVDVTVEHPMRYDDNWGHLHVNLTPGFQHLDADDAVGFARYRHGNAHAKPSPEDGDERRMYRQHVLLRAMIARAKNFTNLAQMNTLIDTGMSTIHTDLTRTQLFDLANLYKGIQPEDMRTASLPGEDFHGPHGAWDYRLYPDKMRAYVDWLVRDDPTRIEHETPIVVKNGTGVPGLAETVVRALKDQGYTSVENGGNAPKPKVQLTAEGSAPTPTLMHTLILDTGVPDPETPAAVAQQLGVPATLARRPVKPNRLGWTPDPVITISLGQDYADAVKAAPPPVTANNPASG